VDYLFSILDKILFIILLLGVGVLAKRKGWISDQGEKDLALLSLEFTWPCLIFYSITTQLSVSDILDNLWLPVLCCVVHIVGYGVGLAVCRIMGYQGDRRRLFLFHATMNNFFTLALPFAEYFFPDKGAALLAVANLGSTICLWTLGIFIIAGTPSARQTVALLYSPCLVATFLAAAFVLTGLNRFIPDLILQAMHVTGQPTLLMGLIIAGTQIYKLGLRALKFDVWNILVGLVRNIIVPGLMLGIALLLRGHMTREALTVFMLVGITPSSVNSVTLAMRYDRSAGLAAEGVIFTHLLAIFTMLGYVALIEMLIV
jgi:predicted permease